MQLDLLLRLLRLLSKGALVSLAGTAFLLTPYPSHAAAQIVADSIVSVATDFSVGAMGSPPSKPFSTNVFYDSRNLTTNPTGGLSSSGWASIGWTVNAPGLQITGQSTEGYNGSYSPGNGFVYGRGHADMKLTLNLDQSYHLAGVVQGKVSGLLAGNDGQFLAAGKHTITAGTLGKAGGFSGSTPDVFAINVSLTPARIPTVAEIFTPNSVTWDLTHSDRRINLRFTPGGGYTVQEAASALGVSHFNWEQVVTHVPPDGVGALLVMANSP